MTARFRLGTGELSRRRMASSLAETDGWRCRPQPVLTPQRTRATANNRHAAAPEITRNGTRSIVGTAQLPEIELVMRYGRAAEVTRYTRSSRGELRPRESYPFVVLNATRDDSVRGSRRRVLRARLRDRCVAQESGVERCSASGATLLRYTAVLTSRSLRSFGSQSRLQLAARGCQPSTPGPPAM